jgi:ribosomal protein S18 acetylase RimI-like enzyme
MLIESVAVDPRHQGRGLGRRLMALAEAEARRQGRLAVRLYTNAKMTENIALYARLGYRETERRPHETRPGSIMVFMEKNIADGGGQSKETASC